MSESAESIPRGAALDGLIERRARLRDEWETLRGWDGRAVIAELRCEGRRTSDGRLKTHLLGAVWRSSLGLAVAMRDNATRASRKRLAGVSAIPPEPGEQLSGGKSFPQRLDQDGNAEAIHELLEVLASGELRGYSLAAGSLVCDCRAWDSEVFTELAPLCVGWAGAPPSKPKHVTVKSDGRVILDRPHTRRSESGA